MKKMLTLAMVAAWTTAALCTVVEWEFPTTDDLRACHNGIPFSDGKTGVLVWGGGDTVNITVSRADLWDHRGGYEWKPSQSYTNIVALAQANNASELYKLFAKEQKPNEPANPTMLSLGRVVVKIPGATLLRGELDPKTGLGLFDYILDGATNRVEMAMDKRAFALKMPSDNYELDSLPSTDHPRAWEYLSKRGLPRAAKIADGFDWRLSGEKPVFVRWKKAPRELFVWTSREEMPREVDKSATFANIAAATKAHWAEFWRKSARVTIPDPVIQRIFDYGMYRYGAMTEPDGIPAGLQGPWIEDDAAAGWNGDYHFNINVQECYAPTFRGGHFERILPLFRMIFSWRPILRQNAKYFAGIEDGYVMPHAVDDRGTCIGGYWCGTIDHGSTAWMATYMFRYVKYSRDLALLKSDIYDFMKGVMNVYLALMEEYNGRLSLPIGPSPEWGGIAPKDAVGRDPSFQLAAAHRLARDLIEAAQMLGEKPDPRWEDVERRLPQYTADDSGIILFEGQQLTESHRHHSHMAGLYPFNTIDFSDPETLAIVRQTYITWTIKGNGYWSGWCVPWASILHTHANNSSAAAQRLREWDYYYTNPGHGSLHNCYRAGYSWLGPKGTDPDGAPKEVGGVMQMDGQCAAVAAVMELLAHDVNGKTEFFRGCPPNWKRVSFENLALSDGRRVSGVRENGKITIWETGKAE